MAGRRGKGPRTPGITVLFEHTDQASIRVVHPYGDGHQISVEKSVGGPLRVFTDSIILPEERLEDGVKKHVEKLAREYGA